MGSMLVTLASGAALLADKAAGNGGGGDAAPTGGLGGMLLPLVLIFALFYFLLIRPQRREQNRRQTMLAAVKKNDHVLTAGGIYGVVSNVDREADEVTIKVDEGANVKLRMTLGSIARVLNDGTADQSDNK
ncbi:MAG: preprotein translocase subunit YajC [Pirellulales bacterium]|nr:preprotein translocase subunit YajC [Pirellulales bacterium]